MVDRVKRAIFRHWMAIGSMAMIAVIIGVCGILVIGRTQGNYWIVFGGNTDPGDGAGGGMARDQFVGGGWVDNDHIYQVQWKADITQDTSAEAAAAMPAAHAAYDAHCKVNRCVIAGFSLGNSPALQLASEVNHAPDQTYLFGAPQPSTGIFHAWYVQLGGPFPPFAQFWLQDMGGLQTNQPTKPGMQVFFDARDPYANAAPQCSGPGVFALSVPAGHYIISQDQANSSHIWTEPDGTVAHEANYAAPPGLPMSGSDPSPLWAGCPPGGWQDSNGTVPGAQSVPGGSPIPSSSGNMPAAPSGVPGVPSAPTFPAMPGTPPPPGG